jgi:hypothetical protein
MENLSIHEIWIKVIHDPETGPFGIVATRHITEIKKKGVNLNPGDLFDHALCPDVNLIPGYPPNTWAGKVHVAERIGDVVFIARPGYFENLPLIPYLPIQY